MRGERGSVLAHVLVVSIVVAMVATGILRMVLTRYQATSRVHESAVETRNAVGSYLRLMSAWNAAGGAVCADGEGYACSGSAGTCSCTCVPTDPAMATVVACFSGGLCQVRACTPPFSSCACP